MVLSVRTASCSAILIMAWSCNLPAADLATVYSPLPEPDAVHFQTHRSGGGAGWLSLPSPQPRQFALSVSLDAGVNPWLATSFASSIEGPPHPDFESSQGGTRGQLVPSYGHMVFKGAAVIVGFELAMMGVMMMLPREAMNWEDDFVQDAYRNLGHHLTSPPVWDEDDWRLNYLGHPYAGSIYYNTVRAQGASWWQSFWFSFAASTFWEYAVEATAEPASTQDLIVTPVGGALMGELVHQLTLSMKKNGTSFLEGVVITVLNPTHVVMKGYR